MPGIITPSAGPSSATNFDVPSTVAISVSAQVAAVLPYSTRDVHNRSTCGRNTTSGPWITATPRRKPRTTNNMKDTVGAWRPLTNDTGGRHPGSADGSRHENTSRPPSCLRRAPLSRRHAPSCCSGAVRHHRCGVLGRDPATGLDWGHSGLTRIDDDSHARCDTGRPRSRGRRSSWCTGKQCPLNEAIFWWVRPPQG